MIASGAFETVVGWLVDLVASAISVVPVISLPSSGGAFASVTAVLQGATYFVPLFALVFVATVWGVYVGLWVGLVVWRWVRTVGAP